MTDTVAILEFPWVSATFTNRFSLRSLLSSANPYFNYQLMMRMPGTFPAPDLDFFFNSRGVRSATLFFLSLLFTSCALPSYLSLGCTRVLCLFTFESGWTGTMQWNGSRHSFSPNSAFVVREESCLWLFTNATAVCVKWIRRTATKSHVTPLAISLEENERGEEGRAKLKKESWRKKSRE